MAYNGRFLPRKIETAATPNAQRRGGANSVRAPVNRFIFIIVEGSAHPGKYADLRGIN